MAAVFYYHVIGDLTVGKPDLVEFPESASLAEAIVTIRDCSECGIPVWKKRPAEKVGIRESEESRQERFVGILNALDIVAYLSTEASLRDPEAALRVPVSQIVVPCNSLLRQVAPATRLVDALEIMKQGVRRLLVRQTVAWNGMTKRFSVLYNGQWLNTTEGDESTAEEKLCCLSREDVIRFLIGCLGKLAPIPLMTIESLGAITRQPLILDSRAPAREAVKALGNDPHAIAVVEYDFEQRRRGGRVIGDISAFKLWKTDHVSAGWALANLTACEFVMGVEDIVPLSACSSRDALLKVSDTKIPKKPPNPTLKLGNPSTGVWPPDGVRRKPNALSTVKEEEGVSGSKPKGPARRFSTRSLDFVNLYFENGTVDKCMSPRPYRGRSSPLTCRSSNSLAAVMAQMLAHRATHVWVTEQRGEDDWETLVGIITYADILTAVSKPPNLPSCN